MSDRNILDCAVCGEAMRRQLSGAFGTYDVAVEEYGIAWRLGGSECDVTITPSDDNIYKPYSSSTDYARTAAQGLRDARKRIRRDEMGLAARAVCQGLGGSWRKQ